MRTHTLACFALAFALLLSFGCSDDGTASISGSDVQAGDDTTAPTGDTSEPGDDVSEPLGGEQAALVGGLATRVNTVFEEHYEELEGLSYEDWTALHALPYADGLDFDPADAAYYDGFVTNFGLSAAAEGVLRDKGFVVVPTWARGMIEDGETMGSGTGPADVFYRVFAADLPVYVAADAILHAFHRSYDLLMETSETQVLIPALERTLAATAAALDPSTEDGADALFYVAVAAALLETPVDGLPAAVQADVLRYLGYIDTKSIGLVDFLGMDTTIDFSQFIPRGHYTRSDDLKRYFKSMMWLGRTDLVLHVDEEVDDPRPREEAAARALAGALQASGADADYGLIDRFYAAFVGRTNALTPLRLLDLCDEAGLSACAGDAAAMVPLYEEEHGPRVLEPRLRR